MTEIMPVPRNLSFTVLPAESLTAEAFLWWAIQDLNPGPSGYENVANFEISFFLWNLVTIS